MADENAEYNKGADGQPVTLEAQHEEDSRRFSPSTGRNRDVVRDVFMANMPNAGHVLEIGSGTGEHGVHMTRAMPDLRWTFTDIDAASLASAKAWMTHMRRDQMDRVAVVDASAKDWGRALEAQPFDGMFCANVIHISPIRVAAGIFAGANRVLPEAGRIFLYGPFARAGEMSEGNAQFDLDLKRRNPEWGVRDLDSDILPLAKAAEFELVSLTEMPKNNLSMVFERT